MAARYALLSIAGVLFLGARSAQAGDRLLDTWRVLTDDTWEVTAQAPAQGWDRDPDFDDSGPEWVTPWINDLHRIWHTSNRSRQSPGRIWFRRVVRLEEREANAEQLAAFFHFDDNGSFVIDNVRFTGETPLFRRGMVNDDGRRDVSDAVSILRSLFLGEGPLRCDKAADWNDSGRVEMSDAIGILRYLFGSGEPPPAPFGDCGPDPTEDDLPCEGPAPCE